MPSVPCVSFAPVVLNTAVECKSNNFVFAASGDGETVMVTVGVVAWKSVPTSQVMGVPAPPAWLPTQPTAETKLTPAGTVKVNVVLVESDGPGLASVNE